MRNIPQSASMILHITRKLIKYLRFSLKPMISPIFYSMAKMDQEKEQGSALSSDQNLETRRYTWKHKSANLRNPAKVASLSIFALLRSTFKSPHVTSVCRTNWSSISWLNKSQALNLSIITWHQTLEMKMTMIKDKIKSNNKIKKCLHLTFLSQMQKS